MGTNTSLSQIVQHPTLGSVTLNQSLDNQFHCVTMQMELTIVNGCQVYDQWVNFINQIQGKGKNKQQQENQNKNYSSSLQPQYLTPSDYLFLPIKHQLVSVGLCGTASLLKVQFQAFLFNLKSEIQNRNKQGSYFMETEIWYLLYNLVLVGDKFQKIAINKNIKGENNKNTTNNNNNNSIKQNINNLSNAYKAGNIHPCNIFINEEGQLKVWSQFSLPQQLDNFAVKLENIKQDAYLAPEQFGNNSLRQRKYPSNISKNKAEVFSIGMTVLAAATLSDLTNEVYRVENHDQLLMSRYQLNIKMKSLGEHYSSFLYSVIANMVKEHPHQRKKASQILYGLRQYQREILQLEPFLPDNSRHPNYRAHADQSRFSDNNLAGESSYKNSLQKEKTNKYYNKPSYNQQQQQVRRKSQKYQKYQKQRLDNFYRKFQP